VIARVALVFAMGVSMAKPPEPLEEIFPKTALIVDAEVTEVRTQDPSDGGKEAPRQVLVLRVNRVLRGALSDVEHKAMSLVVTKPKGVALARVGIKGPWLLARDDKTGEKLVLGRYGPDSWTFEKIELKLKELDPPHLRVQATR
jgi:hypothetical protein